MLDPNLAEQAGDFAVDAAADTAVDGVLNQAIDAVTSHLPAGEMVDQMLKTGIDLNVNNAINSEINKGAGDLMQDVACIFSHSSV
jgi:hypothetical protein